jgi:hypothetical protein
MSQRTLVYGEVRDAITDELLPFVNLNFQDTKVGGSTDLEGKFRIESYYASDTLIARFVGYTPLKIFVTIDQEQELQIKLHPSTEMLEAVEVNPPDENPAFRILRRVEKNKPANDKKKLESYEYEVYNKLQFDINNLSEKFKDRSFVKKMKILDHYLDSTNGKQILPVLLAESISDIFYIKKLNKKKEIIKASRVTGIENLQLEQFTGEMYQDVNAYENNLNLFNKHFISPISDHGKQHYKYYLEDSLTMEGHWCYHIRFVPKRTGQPCFIGDMWIADTSYALKKIKANIPKDINLNFVSNVEIEQNFTEVEPEVWMMTHEKLLADLEIYEGTKLFGLYAHKTTSRKNFVINKPKDKKFYLEGLAVQMSDSAKIQSENYWSASRHDSLNTQENGIIGMVDSVKQNPTFKFIQNFGTMLFSGYYPVGPVELGNLHSLVSFNKIEGWRLAFAMRTSNSFSKIIELGGYIAYGLKDTKIKYGALIRINTTKKTRGLLTAYINSDLEQLGSTNSLAKVGNTFGSILSRGPINRLTHVNKIGLTYEKDWLPGFTTLAILEWKQYNPVGKISYQKIDENGNIAQIGKIETAEVTINLRYGKGEKYASSVYSRRSLGSIKFPIINIQYTAGIKNIFSSDYNYHKLHFSLEHKPKIGSMGRLKYSIYAGKIFGKLPYPFLKVHEGNESYYLQTEAFNNMKFFEFVSDQYVGINFEYHLLGLIMDRIPGISKLKWRIVASAKATWGTLSDRHKDEMIIPISTSSFGKIPYTEVSVGIENIFKFLRIDAVWRVTHLNKEGATPFGVRAKFQFDF